MGRPFSHPLILQTDASNRRLGAVLFQPPCCIHQLRSVRKRGQIKKECLAIWWLVDSFRYYILGRSFTRCSDHALLQWLHRMNDAQITQWYLALTWLKLKVVHRSGAQMIMGDFLSHWRGGIGSARWLPRLSQAMAVCGGGVVCSAAEEWWGSSFCVQCLTAGRAVGTDLGDQSCYFSCLWDQRGTLCQKQAS